MTLHNICLQLRKKMRLLIQLIIFNFFCSYLVRILAEAIYPDGGCSCASTFLRWSVKIFRKRGNEKSVKFLPNYHSLSLFYASNAKYSLKFRQQIRTIYNSITGGGGNFKWSRANKRINIVLTRHVREPAVSITYRSLQFLFFFMFAIPMCSTRIQNIQYCSVKHNNY